MSDELRPNPDDCVIPPPVEPEALEKYLLTTRPFDGSDEIRAYVEGQSPDERVTYLERITAERVLGSEHEIWDVHTSGERYWVITNPTNLYAQRLFPSADYTLSFHVGLMARVASMREAHAEEGQARRAMPAWRRWTQAAEALDRAHEAEDFQAVGMRCRECLLALVQSLADESMVPDGSDAPKAGDFVHWAELIADAVAGGRRAKEVRAHLKTASRSTWQLVSWLTHESGATRLDGEISLQATDTIFSAFTLAVQRFEEGVPSRCPECGSYKVAARYPAAEPEGMYVPVCQACGWADLPDHAVAP